MKKFFALLLFAVSFPVFAGSATFTWTKPDPAFDAPVPAGWIIDEYRIYCTIDRGDGSPPIEYTQTVIGYDVETAGYNDIPGGDMSCYMTSWSIAANAESLPSQTVGKFILDVSVPGSPVDFDFTPQNPLNSGAYPPGSRHAPGLHKEKSK